MRVGARTALRPEAPRKHPESVVRRLVHGTEAADEAVVRRGAASVLRILAPRGALVEPVDRRLELRGGHADRLGQRGDGARPRQPVRVGRVRREGAERVGAAIAAVEDEPGRDVRVRERLRLEVEERAPEVVVVLRLVDEAAAAAVDHQRARPCALREEEPEHRLAVDRLARDPGRGAPPRLAHRPERGACPHRQPEAVADEAGRARRREHRAAEERPDELLVPVEAAGREDDGAVLRELGHARAGRGLHPCVEACLEQAPEQRLAGGQRARGVAARKLVVVRAARRAARRT